MWTEDPRHLSLQFPAAWRFGELPAKQMPDGMVQDLFGLALKIAGGTNQRVLETFKARIASGSGRSSGPSSSYSWAESDLLTEMKEAATNAATFLDGLWAAIQDLSGEGTACPSEATINGLAQKHGLPLRIQPPNLVLVTADAVVEEGSSNQSAESRYDLHEELGRGGFGTVHRATRETSLGTFEYALKLLDPSPFADREKALKRFQREVMAMQSIQHRGLVLYVDAGVDQLGRPYVVMPLIKGRDLRSACQATDYPGRCALLCELLHAVHYAHEHDLLHRDLKPSNVLVRSSDSQVVVVDFGNAYRVELGGETLTTKAIGSAGYIPSEVFADPKKRSRLHDIYSCGIIAYEMFSHGRPDPQAYEPLSAIDPALAALDRPIRKAIAGERDRYRTADEFRADLLRAAHALQET